MIDRVAVRGWLILFVSLSGSAALACGPGFPWQLLDNREQTLRDLPVDSFAFGAARLVPKPALRLPQPFAKDGADPPTTESEERPTLSASNAALVYTMRRQPDVEAAEAVGRLLPDGVRLYVARAVAFGHGDCAGAADRFRRVLALPASSKPDRTLWAGFMLGRALAACGDDAAAATAFQRVRAQVDGGAADPLALALASLGEEARLSLRASGLPMNNEMSGRDDPGVVAVARLHRAVTLYAEQAALDDQNGINSLQLVAEALLSDKPDAVAWLAAVVRDRLLCRLLVLYALSATGPAPQSMFEANDRDVLFYDAPFFPNLSPERFEDRVLSRLSKVMTTGEELNGLDAGRLAALAYLEGSYDLAGQFAAKATGPLAAWIRAKLSLQRNDLRAAGFAYDAAVRELATHPDAMTVEAAGRVRAEAGIVTLARGDFQQAMTILYPLADTYWGDIAYLAERVLTTDELRRFVAANVPQVRPSAERNATGWDPARALRELLARRLMRNGRWADATATFTMTEERREAAAYADALLRSQCAFWRTDRARGAWNAALIARQHGLELFGTELDPDQHAVDGQYERLWPVAPAGRRPGHGQRALALCR